MSISSLTGLHAILQSVGQSVAPAMEQYCDVNSVSVEALFVGFRCKADGKLYPKQPDQANSNGNASWDTCEFILTNVVDGIPPDCDTYKVNPASPEDSALATGWAEADARCRAFYRRQANANLPSNDVTAVVMEEDAPSEPAAAAAEEGATEENKAAQDDKEGDDKAEGEGDANAAAAPAPKKKKRGQFEPKDRSNEQKLTRAVYNGQYVKINCFDRNKTAALEANDLVRIVGFGVSVSIYWKAKSKRYANSSFGPTVGFNFDMKGATRLRQLEDPTEALSKIKPFRFLEKEAPVVDVFFNVAEEGAPKADVRVIRGVELPQDVMLKYGAEVDAEISKATGYDRIYAEALPIESETWFFRDKKKDENADAAAPPRRVNVEPEEPRYPRCTVLMAAVPYKNDPSLSPVEQVMKGQTKVINIRCDVRMADTIRAFGLSRVAQWGRLAESTLPAFPMYIFGRFNSKMTRNNPSNQGAAMTQHSGGFRFFDANYVISPLHTTLGEIGFKVDEPWFNEYFKAMRGPRGGIKLNTLYPYIDNYMHESMPHTDQDIRMLPVWCLSNHKCDGDDFAMHPEDWDLRVVTSTWYSTKDKFSADGLKDQVRILKELGRLPTAEAVKCLNRTPDAQYKVDPTSAFIVYARRNYQGRDTIKAAGQDDDVDGFMDEEEMEEEDAI